MNEVIIADSDQNSDKSLSHLKTSAQYTQYPHMFTE